MKASVKWTFNGHWTAWQANYLQLFTRLNIRPKMRYGKLKFVQIMQSCKTDQTDLDDQTELECHSRWKEYENGGVRLSNLSNLQLWSARESVTIISARDASASEKGPLQQLLAISVQCPLLYIHPFFSICSNGWWAWRWVIVELFDKRASSQQHNDTQEHLPQKSTVSIHSNFLRGNAVGWKWAGWGRSPPSPPDRGWLEEEETVEEEEDSGLFPAPEENLRQPIVTLK